MLLAARAASSMNQGGYVLTNAHVVWPPQDVRVVFLDGSEHPAGLVLKWELMGDLAVIGPLDTDIPPLTLEDGGIADRQRYASHRLPCRVWRVSSANHNLGHSFQVPGVGANRHHLFPNRCRYCGRSERWRSFSGVLL